MRADIQFKRPELSLKEVITAPVEPIRLQVLQNVGVIVLRALVTTGAR